MEEIINYLIDINKKISTMESCTGGFIANSITNIPGASNIFNFGAVTYSNEYKIKLGVNKELIDNYTVYSLEVAKDMARAITAYTNSNYGIGITGKLNKADPMNPYGDDNIVYISVYDKINNKYLNNKIELKYGNRIDNKKQILEEVIILLKSLLNI